MLLDQPNKLTPTPLQRHVPSTWAWHLRRRDPLVRWRKLPTARLGGKKPRRRFLGLVRILKKFRLRYLKLQYCRMVRRLKEHYRNLLKDWVEAGATIESFQQRIFLESTFAIPVAGMLSTFPAQIGTDRPRTTAFI